MTILPPIAEDPAAEDGSDPSIERAERRLRLLEELAEIGMELARGLKQPGPAGGDAEPQGAAEAASGRRRDPAEAFAGLSRAIRLTLMLEERTDQALRDLKAGLAAARQETRERAAKAAADAADRRREDRKARVTDLVMDAAREQISDEADLERLDLEFEERFLLGDDSWADDERPLRQVVGEICAVFDLTPDWRRWTGEGWGAPDRPLAWPWTVVSKNGRGAAAARAGPRHNGHDLE